MITLKQIQYFLSVSETLNLTKSARDLYISQPTLSVAVKELEQECGVPLFHRNGPKISLTDAGIALREEFLKVMRQYDRMQEVIDSGSLDDKGIHFGYSPVIGSEIGPKLYSRFTRKYPSIKIQIREGAGSDLLQDLYDGQLDVVLTGHRYSFSEKWKDVFNTFSIRGSNLHYCVSADNPMADKEYVTAEDVAANPIILFGDTFPITKRIEEAFQQLGLTLNIVLKSSQIYIISRLIADDIGGGFLPLEAGRRYPGIVPLKCDFSELIAGPEALLYWAKGNVTRPEIRKILQIAGEEFSD